VEAKNMLTNAKNSLQNIIKNNLNLLSKPEATYFQRSLNCHHRIPIFYGLPKVHKNPLSLRPVVSTVNSFLPAFSIWLDYQMKELLPLIKSHVKNSIKELNIPDNALLFSADAQCMYTNIDTDIGLQAFADFFISTSARTSDEKQYFQLLKHHMAATLRYCDGHSSSLRIRNNLIRSI